MFCEDKTAGRLFSSVSMIEDVEEEISYLGSDGGNLSLLATSNISMDCGLDITNTSVRIVQVNTVCAYLKYNVYLADPGKALDCSTNNSVSDSFID